MLWNIQVWYLPCRRRYNSGAPGERRRWSFPNRASLTPEEMDSIRLLYTGLKGTGFCVFLWVPACRIGNKNICISCNILESFFVLRACSSGLALWGLRILLQQLEDPKRWSSWQMQPAQQFRAVCSWVLFIRARLSWLMHYYVYVFFSGAAGCNVGRWHLQIRIYVRDRFFF